MAQFCYHCHHHSHQKFPFVIITNAIFSHQRVQRKCQSDSYQLGSEDSFNSNLDMIGYFPDDNQNCDDNNDDTVYDDDDNVEPFSGWSS